MTGLDHRGERAAHLCSVRSRDPGAPAVSGLLPYVAVPPAGVLGWELAGSSRLLRVPWVLNSQSLPQTEDGSGTWELFIIAFRSRATSVLRLDRTLDFRVDATK